MDNKRVVSATQIAVSQRNYRRARSRALTRLAQAYPEQYKQLFEEEKERDELEGKRWTSIADSPYFGMDYTSPNERHSRATQAGKGGNAGNDEGEA